MSRSHRTDQAAAALLLLVFLVQGVAWLGLGYGSDEDSWGIIASWIAMKDDGLYEPSRNQGNLVPEIAYGQLAHWGGPLLTNLFSFGLSLCALGLYWLWLRRFLDPARALLAAGFVASCPYWVYRSVISTDYLFAVCGFLLGMVLYRSGWVLWGIVALAIAGSSRMQYAPLGLVFIAVFEWLGRREPGAGRRAIERLVAFAFIQGLFYVPAFIRSRLTFDFLHVFMPADWGVLNRMARGIYKATFLVGLPATLALGLVAVVWVLRRRIGRPDLEREGWRNAVLGLALAGATYLLFLQVPLEPEYLFPILFVLAAVLVAVRVPAVVVVLIAALMIGNGYRRFDVLRVTYRSRGPCVKDWSVSARPGLTWDLGVLARYGDWNEEHIRCMRETMTENFSRDGRFGGAVRNPSVVPEGFLEPPED